MDVILREDVKDLGRAGQLVKVKPGYARNFLLPKGLAYEATEGNRRRIEAEARARTARQAQDREAANDLAAQRVALHSSRILGPPALPAAVHRRHAETLARYHPN